MGAKYFSLCGASSVLCKSMGANLEVAVEGANGFGLEPRLCELSEPWTQTKRFSGCSFASASFVVDRRGAAWLFVWGETVAAESLDEGVG